MKNDSVLRHFYRISASHILKISKDPNGEGEISNLVNISERGVCFVHKRNKIIISRGDHIFISMKVPDSMNELRDVSIPAEVVWVRPIRDIQADKIGAVFSEEHPMTHEQIRRLLVFHRAAYTPSLYFTHSIRRTMRRLGHFFGSIFKTGFFRKRV